MVATQLSDDIETCGDTTSSPCHQFRLSRIRTGLRSDLIRLLHHGSATSNQKQKISNEATQHLASPPDIAAQLQGARRCSTCIVSIDAVDNAVTSDTSCPTNGIGRVGQDHGEVQRRAKGIDRCGNVRHTMEIETKAPRGEVRLGIRTSPVHDHSLSNTCSCNFERTAFKYAGRKGRHSPSGAPPLQIQ